jgi:hypothetical protein
MFYGTTNTNTETKPRCSTAATTVRANQRKSSAGNMITTNGFSLGNMG